MKRTLERGFNAVEIVGVEARRWVVYLGRLISAVGVVRLLSLVFALTESGW